MTATVTSALGSVASLTVYVPWCSFAGVSGSSASSTVTATGSITSPAVSSSLTVTTTSSSTDP